MPPGPTISVLEGDITALEVDAIVNAANSSLLGGGVDGAIHRAAGVALLNACRRLRATELPGGLPTGQAIATPAGNLPARWVIHTVGPVHSSQSPEESEALLASCYRESLRVADELGASSVAFPTISAGVYGYPMAEATRVAVQTIRGCDTQVPEVILVAFSAEAASGYRAALDSSEDESL